MYLQFNKHFIFVFSTQVSYFNLSFNLSDFMLFFPELSISTFYMLHTCQY